MTLSLRAQDTLEPKLYMIPFLMDQLRSLLFRASTDRYRRNWNMGPPQYRPQRERRGCVSRGNAAMSS